MRSSFRVLRGGYFECSAPFETRAPTLEHAPRRGTPCQNPPAITWSRSAGSPQLIWLHLCGQLPGCCAGRETCRHVQVPVNSICVRHAARLSVRTIPVSTGIITSGRAASHCARVDFRSVGPDYGWAKTAISPSLTTDQGNRASHTRRAPLRDTRVDRVLFCLKSRTSYRTPKAGLV